MNVPNELLFTKSHQWVKTLEDNSYEVGITEHAQKELGDIVFVNLPAVGDDAEVGKVIADIESIKAVSDIMSPLTGAIAAINETLDDQPGLVNTNPYEAWLFKVENVTDKAAFLTFEEYNDLLED